MGWEIEPEGIYQVIKQIGDRYHKPMFISENGIGTKNEQKKIKYLRDHINQVRRLMRGLRHARLLCLDARRQL